MAKKVQPAPVAVHITALEMTAPPKQSLPVPVNVHTAILGAPEIPLAFYRFLYRQVGSRWHWVDRLRMDDETLAATLNDKRNSVTVLYVNGAPAGFFELFQVDEDLVELSHFGLFERALGLAFSLDGHRAAAVADDVVALEGHELGLGVHLLEASAGEVGFEALGHVAHERRVHDGFGPDSGSGFDDGLGSDGDRSHFDDRLGNPLYAVFAASTRRSASAFVTG